MIKRVLFPAILCWYSYALFAQNCACVNVYTSIDSQGGGIVTPAMLIANEAECDPLLYLIELMDVNGDPLIDENGNNLPLDSFRCNHVGETIMASLIGSDPPCMANVFIEDKTGPTCTALPEVILQCDEDTDPGLLRFDTIEFASAGIGLGIGGLNPRYRESSQPIGSGRIVDVSLYIEAQFQDLSGLAMTLIAPDGSFYRMIDQPVSCSGINDLNVTFNNSGNIFDCNNLFGTIQPEIGDLSDLQDMDKAGIWELAATDYNGSPYGIMDSAVLIISYDLMPQASDNCQVNIQYSDDESNLNQCRIGTVTRTFTVTDPGGRTSSCTQILNLENDDIPAFTIEWPRDTVYACDENYDLSATEEGSGIPIITNRSCTMAGHTLINEEFYSVDTPGCITILRFWRVRDWCSNRVWDIPNPQEIKVMDFEEPELSCPSDFFRSVGMDCTLNLNGRIPPASAIDNCDPNVEIRTIVQDDQGNVLNDISALTIGDYTLLYTADDGCGNDTTCQVAMTVVDSINPQAVCDANTGVTLNGNGMAMVCWQTIEDGSLDNCGIDSIRISRDSINFTECIDFTCDDIYAPVEGWMMVWDSSGNTSMCDFQVIVEDKTPPVIQSCADNISIKCWQDRSDTTLTGLPQAIDNCDSLRFSFADDTTGLDNCGLGNVLRTHTVTDGQGLTATCIQTITISPSGSVSVIFPQDTTVECLSGANQDSIGVPVIQNDSCGNYMIQRNDDTLGLCIDGDYRIERDWLVQHMCLPDSFFRDTQYIMLIDTTPPVIDSCPPDMTVAEGPDNVDLSVMASDNCGMVSITNNALTDYGQGNGQDDASGTYPEGVYDIRFIAEDDCGNFDTCDVRITVTVQFDLALSKTLSSGEDEYGSGDTVTFDLMVDNEGPVDAYEIDIVDTLPNGLGFDVALNPDWSANGSLLTTTIDGPLMGGDQTTISLNLIANSSFSGLCYENEAEIEDAANTPGGQTANDVDSTPGNNDSTEDDYSTDFAVSSINLNDARQRECADANGNADFTPSDSDDDIYTGTDPVNISYHETQSDAESNVNPIVGTYNTSGDTLYARIESQTNAMCFATRLLILEAFCSTPVLSMVAQDTVVTCDAPIPPFGPDPILMDSCGATLTMQDDSIPGACPQEYELIRTWTAMNQCGNVVDTSQTISIVDTLAPVITGVADTTVMEGDTVTLIAMVTDNCAPSDSIDIVNNAPVGNGMEDASGVYPVGDTDVTFTATDPCGNSDSVTVTVTVLPMLMASARDTSIILGNDQIVVLNPEDFDNGSQGESLRYFLSRVVLGCPHLGVNDLLFMVEDIHGNRDTTQLKLTLLPQGLPLKIIPDSIEIPQGGNLILQPNILLDAPINICENDISWVITPGEVDCNQVGEELEVQIELFNTQGNRIAESSKEIRIVDPSGNCQGSRTTAMIAGDIISEEGDPMPEVQVHVSGVSQNVRTDEFGHFEIPDLPTGVSYRIEPEYQKGNLNDRVSTIDLVMIRRHILQLQEFDSPYKYIAADVNRSESVTTYDMALIRQAILRVIDDFPDAPSWDFIPESHTFEFPSNPFYQPIPREAFISPLQYNEMKENFIMLKMGDVTGGSFSQNESAEARQKESLSLSWSEDRVRSSWSIDLEPQKISLVGMQFALKIPTGNHDVRVSVGRLKGLTPSNYHFDTKSNILYFSWDQAEGVRIKEPTSILKIYFDSNITLSEQKPVLSEVHLDAEAYGTNNAFYSLELNPSGPEVNNQKALILYQNRPNPVRGSTFIGFELGERAPVILEIFDTDGRLLYSDRRNFESGYGEFNVKASELLTEGVLLYKVSTPNTSITKRMITIR